MQYMFFTCLVAGLYASVHAAPSCADLYTSYQVHACCDDGTVPDYLLRPDHDILIDGIDTTVLDTCKNDDDFATLRQSIHRDVDQDLAAHSECCRQVTELDRDLADQSLLTVINRLSDKLAQMEQRLEQVQPFLDMLGVVFEEDTVYVNNLVAEQVHINEEGVVQAVEGTGLFIGKHIGTAECPLHSDASLIIGHSVQRDCSVDRNDTEITIRQSVIHGEDVSVTAPLTYVHAHGRGATLGALPSGSVLFSVVNSHVGEQTLDGTALSTNASVSNTPWLFASITNVTYHPTPNAGYQSLIGIEDVTARPSAPQAHIGGHFLKWDTSNSGPQEASASLFSRHVTFTNTNRAGVVTKEGAKPCLGAVAIGMSGGTIDVAERGTDGMCYSPTVVIQGDDVNVPRTESTTGGPLVLGAQRTTVAIEGNGCVVSGVSDVSVSGRCDHSHITASNHLDVSNVQRTLLAGVSSDDSSSRSSVNNWADSTAMGVRKINWMGEARQVSVQASQNIQVDDGVLVATTTLQGTPQMHVCRSVSNSIIDTTSSETISC